jgi:AraC family transcriptional regulator
MPSSRLFLHDGLTRQPVRLAADDTIVASSEDADWDGIVLERQHLPAAEADGYMPWHLMSVLTTPPTRYMDFHGGRAHTIPQRPGDLAFRPSGVVTRAAWDGSAETINVALSPDVVTSVAAEMLDGRTVDVADSYFGADARVWHLAHALLHELETGSATALFVDAVRTALAAHVVTAFGRVTPAPVTALSPAELQRTRDLVEAQLASPLSLADLADAVPLSPYHFSRAFKAATGITPHEFVVRRRIEAAKTLLQRGNLPVGEVARRTGFTDASHLARQFRRRVGTSPARYAAAMSRRRASTS